MPHEAATMYMMPHSIYTSFLPAHNVAYETIFPGT